jgi:hypothetical protein
MVGVLSGEAVGQTRAGCPLKRKPAADMLADLKSEAKWSGQIGAIAHQGLRRALFKDPAGAGASFVKWLQLTVPAGLRQGQMSTHLADQARREMLQRFVDASADRVVAGEEPLPSVIGMNCLNRGSQNKIDVARVGGDGRVVQRYQADSVVRELRVGYQMKEGRLGICRRAFSWSTTSGKMPLRFTLGKASAPAFPHYPP